MRRAKLKEFLEVICNEFQQEGYVFWTQSQFPYVLEREHQGETLCIEVENLGQEEEYLELGITVDDGKLSAYFPVGRKIVVEKEGK